MNKRILTNTQELELLADFAKDENTRTILNETAKILNEMPTKTLTKQTKEKLINLGFTSVEMNVAPKSSQIYSTQSQQIDIIDNTKLRVGMSNRLKYSHRWLEININI
jgi:hypothetical protein